MFKKIASHFTKCILIIVWLFFCHQELLAQSFIKLKGRVSDKITNLPLPFTTVYIPNSGTGVVTNEYGEFAYYIPDYLRTDMVHISYMRYKKMYLQVAAITTDSIYSFEMVEEVKELKEVKIYGIKGITAAVVVKRAIKNIARNYPKKEYLLHGYYRDYIREKNTNDYKNVTEAAVLIEDQGFNKSDYQQTKIKLEQIRYNPGFVVDSALNSGYNDTSKYIPFTSYNEKNELAILRLHDPIRNHNKKSFSFVDIFDHSFVPNHSFRYESIIKNDSSEIYEISFGTYRMLSETAKTQYWVEGRIYIDSKNYAILKFIYTVTCKLPSYSGKFFDLTLEYKNYLGKYYLNYLSLCNYFETFNKTALTEPDNPEQYFQYRELFINRIITKPFMSIKPEAAIRKNTILNSNKVPIRDGFWDTYNYTSHIKFID
ncbi:MAG: carboxypeptidase-like regulatory domain-containing protein [Bacteroidales bacterium]